MRGGMASAATASKFETAGKDALCVALGWSRPRLDRRLKSDPNFPVLEQGGPGVEYEFDVDAVKEYLAGLPALVTPPGVVASHVGEATAKQRKDSAQATLLEDRVRIDRGELVERDKMLTDLSTMFARLGKAFDGLPDTVARRLGLPAESGAVIREMVDDMRRGMVEDVRDIFSQVDPLS